MAYKRRLRFDKRIRFRKSMSIMYILLFVVLGSLGTGYAYIKSNLNINGTANVMKANWDVHFENLQITTGSVTASSPASITDDTTVEFGVTLDEPNDFYEFTVDVANEGTMDAMIDSFSITPTLTTAQKKYLEYTITYSDGTPLANKQELKANTTETLKVQFNYIENSNKTNYPTEDQTFNISFTVDYIQTDGSEIDVNHPIYVYTVNQYDSNMPNNNEVQIGQAIPSGVVQYNSASEALAAIRLATGNNDINVYLKHRIENNIVTESYIEIIITQTMANNYPGLSIGTYSLRAQPEELYDETTGDCKSEYYDEDFDTCISPYFKINKQTISRFCSSEYSYEGNGEFGHEYDCITGGGITVVINLDGLIFGDINSFVCGANPSGASSC